MKKYILGIVIVFFGLFLQISSFSNEDNGELSLLGYTHNYNYNLAPQSFIQNRTFKAKLLNILYRLGNIITDKLQFLKSNDSSIAIQPSVNLGNLPNQILTEEQLKQLDSQFEEQLPHEFTQKMQLGGNSTTKNVYEINIWSDEPRSYVVSENHDPFNLQSYYELAAKMTMDEIENYILDFKVKSPSAVLYIPSSLSSTSLRKVSNCLLTQKLDAQNGFSIAKRINKQSNLLEAKADLAIIDILLGGLDLNFLNIFLNSDEIDTNIYLVDLHITLYDITEVDGIKRCLYLNNLLGVPAYFSVNSKEEAEEIKKRIKENILLLRKNKSQFLRRLKRKFKKSNFHKMILRRPSQPDISLSNYLIQCLDLNLDRELEKFLSVYDDYVERIIQPTEVPIEVSV